VKPRRIVLDWPCERNSHEHPVLKRVHDIEDSPEIHTNAVNMCRRKEISGRRERKTGSDTLRSESVDEIAGRYVKSSNDRILRSGDDPS